MSINMIIELHLVCEGDRCSHKEHRFARELTLDYKRLPLANPITSKPIKSRLIAKAKEMGWQVNETRILCPECLG